MVSVIPYEQLEVFNNRWNQLRFNLLSVKFSDSWKLYKAATVLQKYVRGFITRRYIKRLHRFATVLQANWKRYIVRKEYLQSYESLDKLRKKRFFDLSATKIQAYWRGHHSRKKHCMKDLIAWLTFIQETNENMIMKMKEFQEDTIDLRRSESEVIIKEWINYIFPKLHHLQRTKCIPGIYSLKENTGELSTIEKLLGSFSFYNFMKELKLQRESLKNDYPKHLTNNGNTRICSNFGTCNNNKLKNVYCK
uniref:Spermatogenesis-associated protein 17 n=1 Tax=Rhodnius prolixus TaxID=13249 RepID=T1HZ53_RHOPR